MEEGYMVLEENTQKQGKEVRNSVGGINCIRSGTVALADLLPIQL